MLVTSLPNRAVAESPTHHWFYCWLDGFGAVDGLVILSHNLVILETVCAQVLVLAVRVGAYW